MAMIPTERFNLAHEPWIPVRHPDGTASLVSLRDAIVLSPDFTEVSDPSPIVSLCMHRLLIALVYAAYRGPDRLSQVESILAAGKFDADTIDRYLADRADRFFLTGSRPFLQDPSLADELAGDREQPLSIEQLRRETAAPRGPTLFDHTLPTRTTMTFAEAARHVVAEQFFALQDGRGYSQSPLSSGLATWVLGGSLFETLTLNLVPYNVESPIRSINFGRDAPIWERASPLPSPIPDGWLDYLTRPYRRLLLVTDGDEVTAVYRKAGPHLDSDWRAATSDPWVGYRVTHGGTFPVPLKPDQALWRDSHALLRQFARIEQMTPGWSKLLARMGRSARVTVAGVAADSNAISLWREERVEIPAELLGNEAAALAVAEATRAAEAVARVVERASGLLVAEAAQPRFGDLKPCQRTLPKDVKRLAPSLGATRVYWALLEEPFHRFVHALPSNRLEARAAWGVAVREAARSAHAAACAVIATSARGVRAVAIVEPCFAGSLKLALNEFGQDVPASLPAPLPPEPEEATV